MTKAPYHSARPDDGDHQTDDVIRRLIELLAYQAVQEDLLTRHMAPETASGSAEKDATDDQA